MSKPLLGLILVFVAGTTIKAIWLKDDYPNMSWWGCVLVALKLWLMIVVALGLIGMFLYGLALIVGLA